MSPLAAIDQIDPPDAAALAEVGVNLRDNSRPATFIQRNLLPLCVYVHKPGLEMLPLAEALRRYDWLREKYYWQAVRPDLDEITVEVSSQPEPQGFFIWVKRGTKLTAPAGITPGQPPEEVSGTEQVAYHYHPIGSAQPDLSQPCPGCPRAPGYITGRVVDAGGDPLAGVRLVCYNDWHRYPVVGSKGGGEYDFPILQAAATWYVVILDEAD